jgi:hypothetical protein
VLVLCLRTSIPIERWASAVGPSAAKLEGEYSKILSIQNNPKTAHFVIPVVRDSFRYCRYDDDVGYAGYLLEYEGAKVESSCPRLSNRTANPFGEIEIALVRFLRSLHESGLIHGDPRVDNVLSWNGQFKWIDLMDSSWSQALWESRRFCFVV